MTDEHIAAAALRQRLARALALFPDELTVAARLAEEQAAAMAALETPIERGP